MKGRKGETRERNNIKTNVTNNVEKKKGTEKEIDQIVGDTCLIKSSRATSNVNAGFTVTGRNRSTRKRNLLYCHFVHHESRMRMPSDSDRTPGM